MPHSSPTALSGGWESKTARYVRENSVSAKWVYSPI